MNDDGGGEVDLTTAIAIARVRRFSGKRISQVTQ